MCYLECVQTVVNVWEIGKNLQAVLFPGVLCVVIIAIVIIICEGVLCKRLRKICSDIERERKLLEAARLGMQLESDYTVEINEQVGKKKEYSLTIKKTAGGK